MPCASMSNARKTREVLGAIVKLLLRRLALGALRTPAEQRLEIRPRVALLHARHVLGRACPLTPPPPPASAHRRGPAWRRL